jgi:hypothetical protein
MIISAIIIKRPRKERICDSCYHPIVGEQLRLYGCAEQGDKPYPVYLHPECDKSKEVARKLSGGLTPRVLDGALCACPQSRFSVGDPSKCILCGKSRRQ